MGVDEHERFVLGGEVREQLHQDHVLEHVGVIAGMKSVAIAEHGCAGFGGLASGYAGLVNVSASSTRDARMPGGRRSPYTLATRQASSASPRKCVILAFWTELAGASVPGL